MGLFKRKTNGNLSSVQMSSPEINLPRGPGLKLNGVSGEHPSSPLFMKVSDIATQYQPLNQDRLMDKDQLTKGPGSQPFETDEKMVERKLNESVDKGLVDSILEEGVKKPIHLGTTPATNLGDPSRPRQPQILEGNHRFAAALAIDPDMQVPVRKFSPTEDGNSDLLNARLFEKKSDYGGGSMEQEDREWDVKKGYRTSPYGPYTKKGEGFVGRRRRRSKP